MPKIKKLLYKTAKTTGTAAKKLMPGTVRHSFHAPVFGSPVFRMCTVCTANPAPFDSRRVAVSADWKRKPPTLL